jgi:hypothetical protein
MRKTTLMLAAAAASGILALTSASRGASVLTENFTTGDVTDGGLWSTAAVTNPANVSITEPVGGPLTIGVAPVAPPEGGYIQTTSLNTFNFTQGPMLATVTAPVINGVQQNLAPANGGGSTFTNNAITYLGVDVAGASESANGGYTGASRLDTGIDRAYIAVNAANSIEFSLQYFDPTVRAGHPTGENEAINYTFNRATDEIPAPAPNIVVTSMFLYLDAADAANGNFWINGGATWENTTTDTFTTDYLEGTTQAFSDVGVVPFNTDPASGDLAYDWTNPANGYYGAGTAVEAQAIYSQFAGGVAGGVEVDDGATNLGNSVSLGQLTVAVPEPASFGLIALGAGLLLRRKRHQA